jgi:hypothetical protein
MRSVTYSYIQTPVHQDELEDSAALTGQQPFEPVLVSCLYYIE